MNAKAIMTIALRLMGFWILFVAVAAMVNLVAVLYASLPPGAGPGQSSLLVQNGFALVANASSAALIRTHHRIKVLCGIDRLGPCHRSSDHCAGRLHHRGEAIGPLFPGVRGPGALRGSHDTPSTINSIQDRQENIPGRV